MKNPSPSLALSTEAKLAAIIEAQVKGGFTKFDPFLGHRHFTLNEGSYVRSGSSIITGGCSSAHILEILLDPAGLRAIWSAKDDYWSGNVWQTEWEAVGHNVLDAWFSIPEGDAVAAIDTAYNLLPNP